MKREIKNVKNADLKSVAFACRKFALGMEFKTFFVLSAVFFFGFGCYYAFIVLPHPIPTCSSDAVNHDLQVIMDRHEPLTDIHKLEDIRIVSSGLVSRYYKCKADIYTTSMLSKPLHVYSITYEISGYGEGYNISLWPEKLPAY